MVVEQGMISAESERETDLRRVEIVCEIFFVFYGRENPMHTIFIIIISNKS